MAALDFPASPTLNQTFTGPGGVIWVWDGAKWVNGTAITTAYAPLLSPAFQGNPTAPTPAAGDNDTSLATTAFTQAAVAPAYDNVGRNLLHNPLFNIAQRGAGPFTANGYTLDRWLLSDTLDTVSATQATFVDAGRAQIGDEEAEFALNNTFTGNAGATAFNNLVQRVENVRRLANKTVTVSFYAKCASGTLNLGINMAQNFGSGGSPSSSVTVLSIGNAVTLSTTWTRYSTTIAVPSISGKTLGTANNDYSALQLFFSSGATNNASAGNIGVQSGTVSLWGVQLEIGSVATPLEKPDPQQDLAKCQRFYQSGSGTWGGYMSAAGAAGAFHVVQFPVAMRSSPTVTVTPSGGANYTGVAAYGPNNGAVSLQPSATAAGMVFFAYGFTASADL